MTLKPLFDKVIVKICELTEEKKGSFFLPTNAQEKSEIAEVISVGPGGTVDGKEIKMFVKPGDKVLFARYSGSEFKIEGQEVVIIKQSDILAIVE